jgi:hypothetical protein
MSTNSEDIEELEGPFEQIAGAAGNAGSDGSSDGPTLDISLNGEKVTGATKDVWAGQLISLVASANPDGSEIDDPQWTVPGKIIGGYQVEPPAEGIVTPFDNDSLKNTSVWFYWVSKGSKKVTFRGTVGGIVIEAEVTLNVKKPDFTVVSEKNTPPEMIYRDEKTVRIQKYVLFDRRGQTPEGELTWVQLGTIDTTTVYDTRHFSMGAGLRYLGKGLDGGQFKYPSDPRLEDPPFVETDRNVALSMKRKDSFRDWVMFKHKDAGSIWVPVKSVKWNWRIDISRIGRGPNWRINSKGYLKDLQVIDTDEFPVWDSIIPDPIEQTPINK